MRPSVPGPALTEGLPRTRLATLPTPLLPAPRLSEAVGVEVWIKRDDMTGLGLGGNKARKLEFLCGEALARGADTLVTGGGSGSNHVQLTAAAAARLGLDCVAVCYGTDPAPAEPATAGPGAGPSSGSAVPRASGRAAGRSSGSAVPGASGRGAGRSPGSAPPALGLRLTRRFGADVIFTGSPDRTSVDARLEEVAAKLVAEGRVPYVIPRGGASAVGAVGYALAAAELSDQLALAGLAAVTLLVATGSCGTQAGLVAGVGLLAGAHPASCFSVRIVPEKRDDSSPDVEGNLGGGTGGGLQVIGVPVSRPPEECVERIARLATGCAARLGSDRVFTEADVHLLGGYLGPGYGKASPEGDDAALLAARTEGLVLDPVFTAKAMAALVAESRSGNLTGPVVFLHTGGSPSALGALP